LFDGNTFRNIEVSQPYGIISIKKKRSGLLDLEVTDTMEV
jgi:hypothetical protein